MTNTRDDKRDTAANGVSRHDPYGDVYQRQLERCTITTMTNTRDDKRDTAANGVSRHDPYGDVYQRQLERCTMLLLWSVSLRVMIC
uniref:Uncharacterized protein n=1 Tax=Ascaris lumbricoides TaxID=6252 RepID=A0A0M3I9A0_ASCLU